MSTKLDWVYQDRSGEYHAEYKDLVIRAIQDSDARNPFEEDDGHWPMVVLTGSRSGKPTVYDKAPASSPLAPLDRFNDAQLVHWQVHIAKLFNHTVRSAFENYSIDEPTGYSTDALELRDMFIRMFEDEGHSKQFELVEGLYKLIDVPCLNTTVHGYSQGDWADLLIVATPEAVKEFGWKGEPEGMARDMESQAKLYKAWAFGDVYGYQIARKVTTTHCCDCGHVHEGEVAACPQCKGGDIYEETELEDLDDVGSSCWGYYGAEFDESGLEEAAIEAAEMFVRSPDTEKVDAE